jgi:predicted PolB exonuclease-like 3'-5' exonuclease
MAVHGNRSDSVNIFVFDIETVPDIEAGRTLYDLQALQEGDVAKAMFHIRSQETGGSDFLRLHLHRIVAISAVLRSGDRVRVWSLGQEDSPEAELVQRFFDGIERYTPTLVSWNGSGFDLPVLHYRALLHGITAARYWETGDEEHGFRYNHYLGRFHWRHTDLMDVLAGYQARASAPLDQIATLLGFPGKMGMSGAKVWDAFHEGKIRDIRNYCETDVLNTYLVYLRFEKMRGRLTDEGYTRECAMLCDMLAAEEGEHLAKFLQAWQG